ncbi:MAG: HesA/MoeB/ThiF family protein [Deltaproteobacteria bacterium]|nr:HesA/MoeB/ThiF family protein [Deltaproteobacteria bacterium]
MIAAAPQEPGSAARVRRLRQASVALVGVGALGCAAAEALATAGIGRLVLLDGEVVELSNLHRQLLHRTADLGRAKVESAAAKLAERHPATTLEPRCERVTETNADACLRGADCIVDATDGFAAKFLLNDAALRLGIPLMHAGIVRFLGQLMTILPGRSACYRCLFDAPPLAGDVPSCQEAGVLGSLAGTIGLLQAAEVIRYLTGTGVLLTDRLLTYDALAGRWRHVRLRRNPACRACAHVTPHPAGL